MKERTQRWGDGRVFQRGSRWWIAFWDKRTGKERRESAGDTEAKALKKIRKRLGETRSGEFIAGADKLTVKDLLDALDVHLTTKEAKSDSWRCHAAVIRQHFGLDRAMQLTAERLERFQQEELNPPAIEGAEEKATRKKKPATVNRELGVLRQAYRLAVKQKRLPLQAVPFFPMLPERNTRQGYFEPSEFEQVLAHLPQGLGDMARFAYLTGWRRGEIVGLHWHHVDREAREIRLETSKNGDGRVLCYDDELAELIETRWAAREYERPNKETALSPLVFHQDGEPIGDTRKSWATAFEKAQVPLKLFHDLRRTAVRNMVRASVPQSVAMSISGHKTVSMFLRYKITSGDEQREALQKVRAHLSGSPEPARKVVNLNGPSEKLGQNSDKTPLQAPRGQQPRR